jgi:DNA-binding response OmpR family regulator
MKTVLHIEDDEDIRALTALAFEIAGSVNFIQASDGRQGLELVERSAPDLVLLDYMMPGLSGAEVLTQIRAMPAPACNVPVVFVTARATYEDEKMMRKLGAMDVIRKPYDPVELPGVVNGFLAVERV